MGTQGLPKGLVAQLNTRLATEGWENMRQFYMKSGIDKAMSPETVRRAFTHKQEKAMSPVTLATILKYLNYTPVEIKGIFDKFLPGTDMGPLTLGDADIQATMTIEEKALLDVYRRIVAKKPDAASDVASAIDLVAKIAGVQSSDLTDRLRKG